MNFNLEDIVECNFTKPPYYVRIVGISYNIISNPKYIVQVVKKIHQTYPTSNQFVTVIESNDFNIVQTHDPYQQNYFTCISNIAGQYILNHYIPEIELGRILYSKFLNLTDDCEEERGGLSFL